MSLSGAQLLRLNKGVPEVVLDVTTDLVTIGSDLRCHIRIFKLDVERKHCVIERRGSKVLLVNYSQASPVLVNSKPVINNCELHNQDVVTISKRRFIWSYSDELAKAKYRRFTTYTPAQSNRTKRTLLVKESSPLNVLLPQQNLKYRESLPLRPRRSRSEGQIEKQVAIVKPLRNYPVDEVNSVEADNNITEQQEGVQQSAINQTASYVSSRTYRSKSICFGRGNRQNLSQSRECPGSAPSKVNTRKTKIVAGNGRSHVKVPLLRRMSTRTPTSRKLTNTQKNKTRHSIAAVVESIKQSVANTVRYSGISKNVKTRGRRTNISSTNVNNPVQKAIKRKFSDEEINIINNKKRKLQSPIPDAKKKAALKVLTTTPDLKDTYPKHDFAMDIPNEFNFGISSLKNYVSPPTSVAQKKKTMNSRHSVKSKSLSKSVVLNRKVQIKARNSMSKTAPNTLLESSNTNFPTINTKRESLKDTVSKTPLKINSTVARINEMALRSISPVTRSSDKIVKNVTITRRSARFSKNSSQSAIKNTSTPKVDSKLKTRKTKLNTSIFDESTTGAELINTSLNMSSNTSVMADKNEETNASVNRNSLIQSTSNFTQEKFVQSTQDGNATYSMAKKDISRMFENTADYTALLTDDTDVSEIVAENCSLTPLTRTSIKQGTISSVSTRNKSVTVVCTPTSISKKKSLRSSNRKSVISNLEKDILDNSMESANATYNDEEVDESFFYESVNDVELELTSSKTTTDNTSSKVDISRKSTLAVSNLQQLDNSALLPEVDDNEVNLKKDKSTSMNDEAPKEHLETFKISTDCSVQSTSLITQLKDKTLDELEQSTNEENVSVRYLTRQSIKQTTPIINSNQSKISHTANDRSRKSTMGITPLHSLEISVPSTDNFDESNDIGVEGIKSTTPVSRLSLKFTPKFTPSKSAILYETVGNPNNSQSDMKESVPVTELKNKTFESESINKHNKSVTPVTTRSMKQATPIVTPNISAILFKTPVALQKRSSLSRKSISGSTKLQDKSLDISVLSRDACETDVEHIVPTTPVTRQSIKKLTANKSVLLAEVPSLNFSNTVLTGLTENSSEVNLELSECVSSSTNDSAKCTTPELRSSVFKSLSISNNQLSTSRKSISVTTELQQNEDSMLNDSDTYNNFNINENNDTMGTLLMGKKSIQKILSTPLSNPTLAQTPTTSPTEVSIVDTTHVIKSTSITQELTNDKSAELSEKYMNFSAPDQSAFAEQLIIETDNIEFNTSTPNLIQKKQNSFTKSNSNNLSKDLFNSIMSEKATPKRSLRSSLKTDTSNAYVSEIVSSSKLTSNKTVEDSKTLSTDENSAGHELIENIEISDDVVEGSTKPSLRNSQIQTIDNEIRTPENVQSLNESNLVSGTSRLNTFDSTPISSVRRSVRIGSQSTQNAQLHVEQNMSSSNSLTNVSDNTQVNEMFDEEQKITPKTTVKLITEVVKKQHSTAKKSVSRRTLGSNKIFQPSPKSLSVKLNKSINDLINSSPIVNPTDEILNETTVNDETSLCQPAGQSISMKTQSGKKSKEISIKNSLIDITGVEQLFSSPKKINSPKNDLTDVVGVRSLFDQQRKILSPRNDLRDVTGVKRIMQMNEVSSYHDISGVKNLFKENITEDLENQSGPIENISNSEVNMENSFDLLISKPIIKRTYENRAKSLSPVKKVTGRNRQSSGAITENKIDVEAWLREMGNNENIDKVNIENQPQSLITDDAENAVENNSAFNEIMKKTVQFITEESSAKTPPKPKLRTRRLYSATDEITFDDIGDTTIVSPEIISHDHPAFTPHKLKSRKRVVNVAINLQDITKSKKRKTKASTAKSKSTKSTSNDNNETDSSKILRKVEPKNSKKTVSSPVLNTKPGLILRTHKEKVEMESVDLVHEVDLEREVETPTNIEVLLQKCSVSVEKLKEPVVTSKTPVKRSKRVIQKPSVNLVQETGSDSKDIVKPKRSLRSRKCNTNKVIDLTEDLTPIHTKKQLENLETFDENSAKSKTVSRTKSEMKKIMDRNVAVNGKKETSESHDNFVTPIKRILRERKPSNFDEKNLVNEESITSEIQEPMVPNKRARKGSKAERKELFISIEKDLETVEPPIKRTRRGGKSTKVEEKVFETEDTGKEKLVKRNHKVQKNEKEMTPVKRIRRGAKKELINEEGKIETDIETRTIEENNSIPTSVKRSHRGRKKILSLSITDEKEMEVSTTTVAMEEAPKITANNKKKNKKQLEVEYNELQKKLNSGENSNNLKPVAVKHTRRGVKATNSPIISQEDILNNKGKAVDEDAVQVQRVTRSTRRNKI